MKTVTYKLGDQSNGDFEEFHTEQEALENLEYSINAGTLDNIEVIGESGCPWTNTEEARNAAIAFFYVRKHTKETDEDGDVVWEDYEMIAGRIQ